MGKLDEARDCVLQNAFLSAGACGIFKGLVPIPWLEVGALTWVTKRMCDKIVDIYGYQNLSGMSTFFGVVIGAATGAKLAAGILDVVPLLNIGANAVATFTLHTVTGIIVIAACELLDDGAISNKDIECSTIGTISKILGSVTAVIGGFARGNYHDAIHTVKDAFRESAHEGVAASAQLAAEVATDEIQRLALATATSGAKDFANEFGLLGNQHNKEHISLSELSVGEVLDYNRFLEHTYALAFDSLPIDHSEEQAIAAAGDAYGRIYERNCRDGVWDQVRGFDDKLAFYIAGYAKDRAACRSLQNMSQEEIAYFLSRFIQKG
jgi:uncharacterized protein (DUF697 family)